MSGLSNTGLDPKTKEQILADLGTYGRQEIDAAMVLPATAPTSKWGQISNVLADGLQECWLQLAQVARMVDPANAVGDILTGIGRLTGKTRIVKRNPSFRATVVTGGPIAAGGTTYRVVGTTGPLYVNKYLINGGTSYSVVFESTTEDPNVIPNGSTVEYVSGIVPTSVTFVDNSQDSGRANETDDEFRNRIALTIGAGPRTNLVSLLAAVSNLAGTTYVAATQYVGRIDLAIKSSATNSDIAYTILGSLPAGVQTGGTTSFPCYLPAGQGIASGLAQVAVSWTAVTASSYPIAATVTTVRTLSSTEKVQVHDYCVTQYERMFAAAAPGSTITISKLRSVVAGHPLIAGCTTMTVDGDLETDITLGATNYAALTTLTFTWP